MTKEWKELDLFGTIVEFKVGNSTVDGNEELAFARDFATWIEYKEPVIEDSVYMWTSQSSDGKYKYIGFDWEDDESLEESDKAITFRIAGEDYPYGVTEEANYYDENGL